VRGKGLATFDVMVGVDLDLHGVLRLFRCVAKRPFQN